MSFVSFVFAFLSLVECGVDLWQDSLRPSAKGEVDGRGGRGDIGIDLDGEGAVTSGELDESRCRVDDGRRAGGDEDVTVCGLRGAIDDNGIEAFAEPHHAGPNQIAAVRTSQSTSSHALPSRIPLSTIC